MTAILWTHYTLPTPLSIADGSAADGSTRAKFSEEAALDLIRKLSEDIGYRIVGTSEHVEAEHLLEGIVKSYEGWHRTVTLEDDMGPGINVTRPTDTRGDTEVEVWTQIGDGAHRFDFMSSVVWKKYYSMSNVIVRISDGTEEGKEHAVLLNAHLDSTLPSPGAADDGVGVAILVELLRILTTPPRPRLRHSVILLFNNGEESLQDASHLYATQHNETMGSVRGVVNLEACGVSGPELLFQATSVPFVDAYATVPHPFGTVLANDVFSTGLILSDTDFRQFVQYGGLSGLDMAVVGKSYLYHTRKDLIEHFQPGMIQHFGENIIAIVEHLASSPQSKLAVNRAFPKKQPPIYFSVAGRLFFNIRPQAFQTITYVLCGLLNFFLSTMVRADLRFGSLRAVILAVFFTLASLVAALVASNVVALVMTQLLGKSLSWFTHEMLPLGLFGPPAVTAVLTTQLLFSLVTDKSKRAYLE
ncbi:hypothetical protein L7F22_053189 [Adiantum nelumboides]|nr:hypothetical protein [Adiantum nelumboides]